ncbi:hypothetical protein EMIHUDRAFT_239685 [Emiliania huxleyi CCMP1516]|uniref:JmjC domain-containing protein n=2 Tax=Emiliania huxleyi TaxID=2903 RepID=A0A0D3JIT2_EMIH1|nr:hypothetical protein EMIHUDRAFT_239685 [Emiliania huxleyi CCMP1516]EOD23417.1 hypothetical protein EMIHUDRAFT_239685 [Emiliania huxleyi CCMP1516]|eukprot:XP_005775846.1 hypothetical protein EMIHUDRAFT_239685 [Emiliania huxleyi CCMP1516]
MGNCPSAGAFFRLSAADTALSYAEYGVQLNFSKVMPNPESRETLERLAGGRCGAPPAGKTLWYLLPPRDDASADLLLRGCDPDGVGADLYAVSGQCDALRLIGCSGNAEVQGGTTTACSVLRVPAVALRGQQQLRVAAVASANATRPAGPGPWLTARYEASPGAAGPALALTLGVTLAALVLCGKALRLTRRPSLNGAEPLSGAEPRPAWPRCGSSLAWLLLAAAPGVLVGSSSAAALGAVAASVRAGERSWCSVVRRLLFDRSPSLLPAEEVAASSLSRAAFGARLRNGTPFVVRGAARLPADIDWAGRLRARCGRSRFRLGSPAERTFFRSCPWAARWALSLLSSPLRLAGYRSVDEYEEEQAHRSTPYRWLLRPWLYRPLGLLLETMTASPYLYDNAIAAFCPAWEGELSSLLGTPSLFDWTGGAQRCYRTAHGTEPTLGSILLGGVGAALPHLRASNLLHNLMHAFFSPLAHGWHATIADGDLFVLPAHHPHAVLLSGELSLGFKWTLRCADDDGPCEPAGTAADEGMQRWRNPNDVSALAAAAAAPGGAGETVSAAVRRASEIQPRPEREER